MPNPTIKPLFVALFMTLMFAGMIPIHLGKTPLAVALDHHLRASDDFDAVRLAPDARCEDEHSTGYDRRRTRDTRHPPTHHRARSSEGRDLGLHRVGVHAVRVAHLDVSRSTRGGASSARSRTRRGQSAAMRDRAPADPQHPGHVGVDVRAAHVVADHGARARRGGEQGRSPAGPAFSARRSSGSWRRRFWARRSLASRPTSSPRSCTKG